MGKVQMTVFVCLGQSRQSILVAGPRRAFGGRRMSAGFKVAGEVFWGTNGAVESYVEALAAQAATRFGTDSPLTVFFSEERDGFSSGKIVYLDKWLTDAAHRERFLELLDAATEQLLREGAFTEYGREWVASVMTSLRARVAGGQRLA
jgi:hypothetical protein